ncbi:Uncharacterised protein [Mycobacteroides abscessus subsp. abscessus]|nr:Uncharacterised protein [Mycobacteroides abscessus subsp. abscessus]
MSSIPCPRIRKLPICADSHNTGSNRPNKPRLSYTESSRIPPPTVNNTRNPIFCNEVQLAGPRTASLSEVPDCSGAMDVIAARLAVA